MVKSDGRWWYLSTKLFCISTSYRILALKSKGLSKENIKPPAILDHNFALGISFNNYKVRVNSYESWLKQGKISSNLKNVANLYVVHELNL